VAQRVGRGIALLVHDSGTRREWVVSSTLRPHFTPGKDPVPILQEAGWTPGPVWTGGKSRPHRDSIPDRRITQCIHWIKVTLGSTTVLKAYKKEKKSNFCAHQERTTIAGHTTESLLNIRTFRLTMWRTMSLQWMSPGLDTWVFRRTSWQWLISSLPVRILQPPTHCLRLLSHAFTASCLSGWQPVQHCTHFEPWHC
jgi:hypothetical protein